MNNHESFESYANPGLGVTQEAIGEPNQYSDDNSKCKQLCAKVSLFLIITVLLIALASACFGLAVFAMNSSVNYFSFMFSLTEESFAKVYLKQHYGWFMTVTYLTIFGCVLMIAGTLMHFTQFTQKQKMLIVHSIYFLVFLVSGIVALVADPEYLAKMKSFDSASCAANAFECSLSTNFNVYIGSVTTFFIGYCICFPAYAALFHFYSYKQRIQREEQSLDKAPKQLMHQPVNMTTENYDGLKNTSFVSQTNQF